MGTSLIRKRIPLEPYRRPLPRVLVGSWGGIVLAAWSSVLAVWSSVLAVWSSVLAVWSSVLERGRVITFIYICTYPVHARVGRSHSQGHAPPSDTPTVGDPPYSSLRAPPLQKRLHARSLHYLPRSRVRGTHRVTTTTSTERAPRRNARGFCSEAGPSPFSESRPNVSQLVLREMFRSGVESASRRAWGPGAPAIVLCSGIDSSSRMRRGGGARKRRPPPPNRCSGSSRCSPASAGVARAPASELPASPLDPESPIERSKSSRGAEPEPDARRNLGVPDASSICLREPPNLVEQGSGCWGWGLGFGV